MEIAKLMPRFITRMIANILQRCMKFHPDYKHDMSLWIHLDTWLTKEAELK